MSQIKRKQFKICFDFENEKDYMYCDIKETLINVFKKYSEKKGIDLDSIYFLCNGEKIEDFQKTLEQIANTENKIAMEIYILVIKILPIDDDSMKNAYFLKGNEAIKIPCKKTDSIRETINKYENLTNCKPNSLIYKHKGIQLDPDKTFEDYDNINNDIFITVIPKTLICILFVYLNVLYKVECYKEDKIEDICDDFASKNKIDKKLVKFMHKNNLVDKNQTLNQFINENNMNINEIKIDVVDINFVPPPSPVPSSPTAASFWSVHLTKVIIVSVITVAIIATFIVFLAVNNSDEPKCDPGYISKDGKCIEDYFIKAIYFSNDNEKIELISDNYQIDKIKNMIIDGNTIQPAKFYTFTDKGNHTVYLSFNPIKTNRFLSSKDKSQNDGSGIFEGIKNLLYVEFSNYSENYLDVSFDSMFKNCINLKSVDLSKISLDYKTDDSYTYGGNYFDSMSYMFYNCSSLTYLEFPTIINPDDMSYSFAFCSSLTSLSLILGNLLDFKVSKSISNAFRNCTSLKSLTLYDYISYEDYSYLFMGCILLSNLTFFPNFSYNTKYLNNMFSDCSLLKVFNNPIFDAIDTLTDEKNCLETDNLIDISGMFSGCSSLTSVDLSWFLTKEVRNYEGIFYDCHSLSYIDMSSFTHNNLNGSNLSIFNDNIPLNSTIVISYGFYYKIQNQIPPDSNIENDENCIKDEDDDDD